MQVLKCAKYGGECGWDAEKGMCAKCGAKDAPMTDEEPQVRPRLATTPLFQKKK